MRIIKTQDLDVTATNATEQLWAYNGIDCTVTYEVLEKLLPQLRPDTLAIYNFSRELQGPLLEMGTRGLRVDEQRRQALLTQYRTESLYLGEQLARILREGLGFDFVLGPYRKTHYPSPKELCDLFYNYMRLPVIYKVNDEGQRVPTVDRKALEKLEAYFYAEPIVRHLYVLREHAKKISFLSTSVDRDGRLRTSFNIAGTTTGRLASSLSELGTGTNLQNVENRLRAIFIADPGYKFCNIDLEQSDSRVCGAIHWNLFRDARYLDACESGDLHTSVARIAYPQLRWTGDRHDDRSIADGKFYREFSYRDSAKRLGHGTNYKGEPPKMSRETHIPQGDIEAFQRRYLPAYAFQHWWDWVADQILAKGRIITLMGRPRRFFGHPKDDETIRAAIAYEPQSVTADTINRGLLKIWKANRVQILLQVHDSILFQYPEDDEDVVPWAIEQIQQTIRLAGGRDFTIPAEAKVGWSWTDDPEDPDALRKWPDVRKGRERCI